MKQSQKGFTLVEIMIVVVIIGLLTAMAIPAFQKVRESTQTNTVVANLEQIQGAGQRYLMEFGGSSVDYTTLVGDEFFTDIQPVAGEDYTVLTVESAGTLAVSIPKGEVVLTY